jgi:S-adenosylmethionine:tRNA ribosyltransferase-isomerase
MVMWVGEGDCIIQNLAVVKSPHTELRTSDFDYHLPQHQIATQPAARRDGARLMVLDRFRGGCNHEHFREIARLLPPRALVVLNDAKVIPARLRGHKSSGGTVELLLTRMVAIEGQGADRDEVWEALGKNLGRAAVGDLEFAGGLRASLLERRQEGRVLLRFWKVGVAGLLPRLDDIGEIPLPPYIEAARKRTTPTDGGASPAEGVDDRTRYQTVYARAPGAVAAPTAGLHFTPELLDEIRAAGHDVARLTLHVGPGTFRPVKSERADEHVMDEERYEIPEATARAVSAARADGRPLVAVGTTVVRALEAAARVGQGEVDAGPGATDLFLRPGDPFQVVTDLITNFHLPRSTLLMLVAAFAGRERVLGAYQTAIEQGYRFYSYGDAMLITGRAGAP